MMLRNQKNIYLLFFVLLFAATSVFAQKSTDDNIVCFVYHRFGDDRYPSTNISINDFEGHLQYLKDNGYNVVTLGQALNLLNSQSGVPGKTAVLTIDDGYKSFLDNAMPLLRKFNYKATLFLNTKQVGNKDFVSWHEVKGLMDEGIEIGDHSHSHAYFVNNKKDEIVPKFKNDLKQSQEIFIKELGFAPDLFSYPYGEYTNSMKEVLKELGFRAAIAQNSGVISGFNDMYALPRFPMTGIFSKIEKFIEKANMKALPVAIAPVVDPVLLGNNPPILQLQVKEPDLINTNYLQCFVGGATGCTIDYDSTKRIITIKSNHTLTARRTLYTITAPSATNPNSWYWFSYVWIIPTKY